MIHTVPWQDQPLPEYEQPPLVEVVLAVQFEDDIGFGFLDLATIASQWSQDLPHVEERPPLARISPGQGNIDVEVDTSQMIETPRLWLYNDAGNRVLQIQQDRLAVNWQKGGQDDTYPRYSTIRTSFINTWSQLSEVIDDLGLPMPSPSICEVTYVNHIGSDKGWSSSEDTPTFIAPLSGCLSDEFLSFANPEVIFLHYHFPDKVGWLQIESWSSSSLTGEKQLELSLTARGLLSSEDFESALNFMDIAHEWIVRGFTSVTTPYAHNKWKRIK